MPTKQQQESSLQSPAGTDESPPQTTRMISEWDELEARSLLSAVDNGAQDTLHQHHHHSSSSSSSTTTLSRRVHFWKSKLGSYYGTRMQIIFLLTLCAIVMIFKEDIVGLMVLDKEVNVVGKIPVEVLRTLALEGKKEFDNEVTKEYGHFAQEMFRSESVLTYFKTPSDAVASKDDGSTTVNLDLSRERLKRRLKIKIIESQLMNETTTNFTWVIGGHSAAAGHGNLLRQAYANIIEQSLRGVFGSLGIQFYAKNYAMGGTKSGPEIALCMESVFGRYVDIVSWDYGMTDGRSPELYHLWTYRAGMHPTRPILFSYGQRYADSIHKEVEDAGGAGFEMNFLHVKSMFPNSDDTNVDVSQLPPAVKNYVCNNGHVESGEPCGDKYIKYDTNHKCPKIGYQVSWHNGWKDHLLIGRLSAAFIIENLLQAIDELSSSNNHAASFQDGINAMNPSSSSSATKTAAATTTETKPFIQPSISSSYLAFLKEQENQDRESFLQTIPPGNVFEKRTHVVSEIVLNHLKRSWSFCRTAVLPNQARYDGVVMGEKNRQPANYLYSGKTDYKEKGYDIRKGLPTEEPENNQTEPYLVYNLKNNRDICSEAEIDFKDVFYVRYKDNWMTTTVPNNAEEEYYSFFDKAKDDGSNRLNGIIMLCTVPFDWGNYSPDYVTIHEMVLYKNTTNTTTNDNDNTNNTNTTNNETTTTTTTPAPTPSPTTSVVNSSGIVVNGILSTDAIQVHEDRCYVLKHNSEDSGYFFPPNSEGKFEIQFRVPREGNLYLNSIIVL